MDLGTVAALWRYPVKSLRAEPLERTTILADGLEGDRAAALIVESPAHARIGKPYRGKESPRLHLTADPETAASYAHDANVEVALDRRESRYFDRCPVSVLFDLWVRDAEALVGEKLDPLRWRPNLYVTAAPGFARREPDLVGTILRAGGVVLRVVGTIGRCVTTTYDVATGEPLPLVLSAVARHRDNVMGVYCEVVMPSELAVGDTLTAD
ncbi:MAG TPA: MOSC N-terminal beta barrel domain-containing protein [Candidatus Elarobacter sp.]|nr:MOSC N-terminal beta barrel domain-containing protein [Candidatus Elarobacter sp.]